jgi:hypothetical protein
MQWIAEKQKHFLPSEGCWAFLFLREQGHVASPTKRAAGTKAQELPR